MEKRGRRREGRATDTRGVAGCHQPMLRLQRRSVQLLELSSVGAGKGRGRDSSARSCCSQAGVPTLARARAGCVCMGGGGVMVQRILRANKNAPRKPGGGLRRDPEERLCGCRSPTARSPANSPQVGAWDPWGPWGLQGGPGVARAAPAGQPGGTHRAPMTGHLTHVLPEDGCPDLRPGRAVPARCFTTLPAAASRKVRERMSKRAVVPATVPAAEVNTPSSTPLSGRFSLSWKLGCSDLFVLRGASVAAIVLLQFISWHGQRSVPADGPVPGISLPSPSSDSRPSPPRCLGLIQSLLCLLDLGS